MSQVEQEKALLRKKYLDLRHGIDPMARQTSTQSIYEHLFALPQWSMASLVCGYISIRGEIDTTPILEEALRQGKSLALPCTTTDASEGQMVFRILQNGGLSALETGRFGIPEPSEDCHVVAIKQLQGSLMLLPGLAFDKSGHRLGYGGGYYDRYLEKASLAGVGLCTVALAYSALVTDTLPHASFDYPAHIIITEKEVYATYGQT